MWKEIIKKFLRRRGYAIVHYHPFIDPDARLWGILDRIAPTVVLDVGAHEGEFAQQLRAHGYQGRIVSFEPRAASFAKLRARLEHDRGWTGFPCGLGECDGNAEIHVSGNTESSSLLPMQALHVSALPRSQTQRSEPITIRSLDSLRPELGLAETDRIFLKVDVQGYELSVLAGAASLLPAVSVLLLELSLQSLYEGSPLIEEVIATLRARGFVAVSLAPTFSHPDNLHLQQADGLFVPGR